MPATPGTVLIAGGGTGGHLMPALAIAAALAGDSSEYEPVLVGSTRGVEQSILPGRPFRYHLLPTEPIYRRQWWKNFRWPWLGWRLLREAGALLEREQPVAVVGTGGYAAAPLVWLAARRGIPTAIQEQNAFPGLATRWLARRVRHIYLGVPEAGPRLRLGRQTEVFDTGNPIVPPDPARRPAALARFGLADGDQVVLVTGGSQGALAVNRAVAGWIREGGAEGYRVLWATGRATWQEFAPLHRPPAVQVFDFLDPMADAMAVATLAIARAGAMTLAELCAWGIPSILVPLPTAAADHQRHNAEALAAAGAATHLPQSELSAARLRIEVAGALGDVARMKSMASAASLRGRPDAAAAISGFIRVLSLESAGNNVTQQR